MVGYRLITSDAAPDSRDASIFRHHESLQAELAMEREDEDRPE
jgi:hypothetical protein